MPKVGMEPIRRKTLIDAVIDAVYDRGSLDITIGNIAKRAGVSQGLAHHYFDSKDDLLIAAMRSILKAYSESVNASLKRAQTPRARASAIISASLSVDQFDPKTVSAWLVFYVHAQKSPAANRLLTIYRRRLISNLVSALKPIAHDNANDIAAILAALIDGFYIRRALGGEELSSNAPYELTQRTLEIYLKAENNAKL